MIFKILPLVLLLIASCGVGESYELVKEQTPSYIVLEFDPSLGGDMKNLFKAKKHCAKFGKEATFHKYIEEKPKYPQNIIVMYECYGQQRPAL